MNLCLKQGLSICQEAKQKSKDSLSWTTREFLFIPSIVVDGIFD